MMRVGRFEIDERDARARCHLARVAWVPRSRREAWATRLLAACPMLAGPAALRLMGRADDSARADTTQDDAVAAVNAVLGAALQSPSCLLPAASAASPRRLLFLWREGADEPHALAKVARGESAGPLQAEADALEHLGRSVPALQRLLPPVLGRGTHGGLSVLVLGILPGVPLLRRHRLARPLAWRAAPHAELGRALGTLHASTLDERGRARLHGDAWSRNVLVSGDALSGLVDWEASRVGEPAAEIAHFLRASAAADAAGRATPPGGRLEAWPAGAAALVDAWAGTIAHPGCTKDAVENLLNTGTT